jgi:hypothetical protein
MSPKIVNLAWYTLKMDDINGQNPTCDSRSDFSLRRTIGRVVLIVLKRVRKMHVCCICLRQNTCIFYWKNPVLTFKIKIYIRNMFLYIYLRNCEQCIKIYSTITCRLRNEVCCKFLSMICFFLKVRDRVSNFKHDAHE